MLLSHIQLPPCGGEVFAESMPSFLKIVGMAMPSGGITPLQNWATAGWPQPDRWPAAALTG